MNEKDLELAETLTRAMQDEAIDRARRAAMPERHPDFDGFHCIDCDILIPEGRRLLGKIRCVPCQSIVERVKT